MCGSTSAAGSPVRSFVPPLGSLLRSDGDFIFQHDLSRVYTGALVALREETGDEVTFRLVEVVRIQIDKDDTKEMQFVVKTGIQTEKRVAGQCLFAIDRAH